MAVVLAGPWISLHLLEVAAHEFPPVPEILELLALGAEDAAALRPGARASVAEVHRHLDTSDVVAEIAGTQGTPVDVPLDEPG